MKRTAMTLLPLAVFFAAPVFAQQASQPAMDMGHMHKMDGHMNMQAKSKTAAKGDEFTQLDINKDGFLSKTELAKHALAPHFDMVDANHDGKLSKEEFAAGLKMIGK